MMRIRCFSSQLRKKTDKQATMCFPPSQSVYTLESVISSITQARCNRALHSYSNCPCSRHVRQHAAAIILRSRNQLSLKLPSAFTSHNCVRFKGLRTSVCTTVSSGLAAALFSHRSWRRAWRRAQFEKDWHALASPDLPYFSLHL